MRSFSQVVEAIKKSDIAVGKTAEYLKSKGFEVNILPKQIAPNREERWKYVDSGDIEVIKDNVKLRVEVKNISINFNSIESFPFSNIIVDEAYKVDKIHTRPLLAYFIWNPSLTGFFYIPVSTKKLWFKSIKNDSRDNRKGTYYSIKKEYVKYVSAVN